MLLSVEVDYFIDLCHPSTTQIFHKLIVRKSFINHLIMSIYSFSPISPHS